MRYSLIGDNWLILDPSKLLLLFLLEDLTNQVFSLGNLHFYVRSV
jgi:hypothetical protein